MGSEGGHLHVEFAQVPFLIFGVHLEVNQKTVEGRSLASPFIQPPCQSLPQKQKKHFFGGLFQVPGILLLSCLFVFPPKPFRPSCSSAKTSPSPCTPRPPLRPTLRRASPARAAGYLRTPRPARPKRLANGSGWKNRSMAIAHGTAETAWKDSLSSTRLTEFYQTP